MVAAIAKLPVIMYDIKTVSQVARILQDIDFPTDLDLFSFTLFPRINTVS